MRSSAEQSRLLRALAWTSIGELVGTFGLAAWPLAAGAPLGYSGFATSNADVPLATLVRALAVWALASAGVEASTGGDRAARRRQQQQPEEEQQQHQQQQEDGFLGIGDADDDDEEVRRTIPLLAQEEQQDDDDGESGDETPTAAARRRRRRRRRCRAASDAVSLLALLLLMAKAVAVAVLSPDGLWPSASRHVFFAGLLPLFASIVASMAGAAACGLLARAAVGKAKRPADSSSSPDASKQQQQQQQRHDDDNPFAPSSTHSARQTLRELVRLSRPDAPILLAAFAAGAVAALFSAAIPLYTGRVVDRASIEPDRRQLLLTSLKLVLVGLLCGVFTGVRGGLFTLAMTRLNVRLRSSLLRALLAQDAAFFDATPTGELTSRLAADCESVSNSVALNLNVAFRSALQAAVVLAFMFSAQWRLTVVTFVIVPATLALANVYGRFYHRLARKVQASLAEANAVAEEALGAWATVRAHGAAAPTAREYDARLSAFARLENRAAAAYVLNAAATTFLPVATAAGVLFFGGTLVLRKEMTAGNLISFMLYQTSLASAFGQLGDVFGSLASAVGAAAKVTELLRRAPRMPPCGSLGASTVASAPPPPLQLQLQGRVELRDVHFAYPSRPSAPVLRGLSVSIEPGGTLALVGPSGGGKSSIVKLVGRLYLPSRGRVLLDGRDVGRYDDRFFRRRVAWVPQTPVLFRRSVRDNILYGLEKDRDGVADEDVIAAAKAANAHDFISAFPQGYDTCVGGRGASVSGGQCARIAIARALVRRPAVLMLDEATSALDAESEHLVQSSIDGIIEAHGCTVLVVAHRLNTVVGASRIAVVSKGVVVESGTHSELVGKEGGAYASLVARQLRGGASSGGGLGGGSWAAL